MILPLLLNKCEFPPLTCMPSCIYMNKLLPYCILLTALFNFLPAVGQNTYSVSGKVIDNNSKQPLAFVNIIINSDNRAGGTTDIDGKFHLQYREKINSLTLSYLGYKELTFPIGAKYQNIVILMTQ